MNYIIENYEFINVTDKYISVQIYFRVDGMYFDYILKFVKHKTESYYLLVFYKNELGDAIINFMLNNDIVYLQNADYILSQKTILEMM